MASEYNPFKLLREELKLTQHQLADRLDITEQTVRRLEHGTFTYPPLKLETWYNSEYAKFHDLHDLAAHSNLAVTHYNAWRKEQRLKLQPVVQNLTPPDKYGVGMHPFEMLRWDLMSLLDRPNTVAGFCKLVHLEPKVVTAFEESYTNKTPEPILMFFIETKYRHYTEFDKLIKARHAHFVEGVK